MVRKPSGACAALLVGGALLVTLGVLALYGRSAVLDERAFADRATAALASDEVREEVGERIARREIEAEPALAPLRPTLDAAVDTVVTGWEFPRRFHDGAAAMHRALFHGGTVDLTLPGTSAELVAAAPPESRVRRLLPSEDQKLFKLGGGPIEDRLLDAAPAAAQLSRLAPLALLAGLVLLAASAWRAPTRRRGARRAALGIALAGGAIVAGTTVGRAVVLSTFDTSHGDAVVGQIWDAYLGDLRMWGLACGALGLIVAAACEPGARGAWRRAVARVASPCGSGARMARAFGLLVLAALLLWMPEIPVDLALVSASGVLVFSAAAEVVRLSSAR